MRVLFFGAGAIGRGFVCPVLTMGNVQVDFVDQDPALVQKMNARKEYEVAVAHPSGYQFWQGKYENCFLRNDQNQYDVKDYDVVMAAVGPRNCLDLVPYFSKSKTVIILENDRDLVDILRKESKNPNIYFGIPDVITSSTAPPELLAKDPLCLVTERGRLIFEDGNYPKDWGEYVEIVQEKDLAEHWVCKFFIHNACHAMVSFLGAMRRYEFIHQAMADDRIGPFVKDAMAVVTESVVATGMVQKELAYRYRDDELKRFYNPLLFDPIERVARDPFRKLDENNRMVRAIQVIEKAGLDSTPMLLGVSAAMEYRGQTDDDIRFAKYRRVHHPKEILQEVCGIHNEDLVNRIVNTDPYEHFQKTVEN